MSSYLNSLYYIQEVGKLYIYVDLNSRREELVSATITSPMRLSNTTKPCMVRHVSTTTVNARAVNSIKELHGHLLRKHLNSHPSLMFDIIKCYALSPPTLLKAQFCFDQINHPTLSLWNIMIRGWSQSDHPKQAIYLHNLMYHHYGLHGNNLTLIFILKIS